MCGKQKIPVFLPKGKFTPGDPLWVKGLASCSSLNKEKLQHSDWGYSIYFILFYFFGTTGQGPLVFNFFDTRPTLVVRLITATAGLLPLPPKLTIFFLFYFLKQMKLTIFTAVKDCCLALLATVGRGGWRKLICLFISSQCIPIPLTYCWLKASPMRTLLSPVRTCPWPQISSLNCHHFVCWHFATRYEWKFLHLFFRDEVICLLQVMNFQIYFEKIEIIMNFLRKKQRKFTSNTKYTQKIWNFHYRYIT